MSPIDFVDIVKHRGGALQLGLIDTWSLVSIAPNALVRRFATDLPALLGQVDALLDGIDTLDEWVMRLPLTPHPMVEATAAEDSSWLGDWLGDDKLAQSENAGPRQETITVPVLQIAGWYDLLLQGNLDAHVAMRERAATDEARALTRLVVGPWAHPPPGFVNQVGDIDFGFRGTGVLLDGREDLTSLHKRWFDARLKGLPSGIDDEPPVKLFVMGRNRWRTEDEWPLKRARAERWHLHGDGTLSPRAPVRSEPSVFSLDPDNPVPTVGGNILMKQSYVRGPVEQARVERHPDTLTFTSEPLTSELEVTGRVTFTCWIAADTVDTDVVARLCDVHPDGRSFNVVDGIQRARFREGLADPRPLTPGEISRIEVDLWSTSFVFMPGHRVRVQVRASDFPRYDRCPGTGESSATAKQILPQRNLLFHDPQRPSHITVEVVPS
jgi:putative CocE/NonD family hydrolase